MKYLFTLIGLVSLSLITTGQQQRLYSEPYRPQIHFSPKQKWMNDPNGMVYYKGTYHLFFQYYPDSTIWGPMHWGHAISKDLVHWKELPIALYPDSLGYIFSGSAVVDINNTSGFGANGKIPMVAIFTHHNPKLQKAGSLTYQNQSIAYSLDEGKTWTKYAGNPVLKNPGIKDFRDPKVSWYEPDKKWIMILATKDRVTFFSSKNLKEWTRESDFGAGLGAHAGVWECPDLFPLNYKGKKVWVLTVSTNPGGPNKGSATQYFIGQFDGQKFTPYASDTRWIDYGPDDYAGVTWSNTGNRKIFLGWMSNWQYARLVPTVKWRSAMTLPRELGLQKIDDKFFLTSHPCSELKVLNEKKIILKNVSVYSYDLSRRVGRSSSPAKLQLSTYSIKPFVLTLSNDLGEKVMIGYDKSANQYFIDRTNSGIVNFEKGFAGRHVVPRLSNKKTMELTLIIDDASVELFGDDGLSVMTEIFFPNSPFTNIKIQSNENLTLSTLSYNRLKRIWQ